MTLPDDPIASTVKHYEACLRKNGVSPQGVDWPNATDLEVRFDLLLSIANHVANRCSVLDLGCGPALLLDYLSVTNRIKDFDYTGIDISEKMIAAAENRWPEQDFGTRNILESPYEEQQFDIVIMNGVLTEKRSASFSTMRDYAQQLIRAAFHSCRHGLAFNVMSKFVDWERDDLFHWSLDDMGEFISRDVSRHFEVRHSYGLYEYTVFVLRQPTRNGTLSAPDELWWKR